MSKKPGISMSVIRRMPRYYRFIKNLKESNISRISSKELSKKMNVTASQIRQDFNNFGEFGLQGYGYNVDSLFEEIRKILGLDTMYKTVLIGSGNLGKAIASHMDFNENGFDLIGIFDSNIAAIGRNINGIEVLPDDMLEEFCHKNNPKAAILCIPKTRALETINRLVNLNVKGFWNFSPMDIEYKDETIVFENVHLSDSMMTLCYRMNERLN